MLNAHNEYATTHCVQVSAVGEEEEDGGRTTWAMLGWNRREEGKEGRRPRLDLDPSKDKKGAVPEKDLAQSSLLGI